MNRLEVLDPFAIPNDSESDTENDPKPLKKKRQRRSGSPNGAKRKRAKQSPKNEVLDTQDDSKRRCSKRLQEKKASAKDMKRLIDCSAPAFSSPIEKRNKLWSSSEPKDENSKVFSPILKRNKLVPQASPNAKSKVLPVPASDTRLVKLIDAELSREQQMDEQREHEDPFGFFEANRRIRHLKAHYGQRHRSNSD